jgi:hypothetical protein
MIPQVLKLDVAGCPVEWISWRLAVTLYARERVQWEAGQARFTLTGGRRGDGSRSSMTINSIIAVHDRSRRFEHGHVPLTNRALFQRDGYRCLYCGEACAPDALTRDHVVPVSRGGVDAWTNVVSACVDCNQRKDAQTPEEAGMPLLALPYRPDPASYLLLVASGRRITACQMSWLAAFVERGRRPS